MKNLTAGRLRHRLGIHSGKQMVQENGETATVYRDTPDRYIWANLVPYRAAAETLSGSGEIMEITHKCYVRALSLPDIKPDMYVTYRGQQYRIVSYMPYYRQPDWLELSCVLVVENGELSRTAGGLDDEYY